MQLFAEGLAYLMANPMSFVYMTGGILMGIIFGCIPGLTAVLGVTLMIPFTYAMSAAEGLSTLIGIYVGGISGGLISACLLKIPGTSASLVTTWDGYPMVKRGKPEAALSLGVFASLIGGTFSAIVLATIAPQLSKVTLKFGHWEYFALIFFSICVVLSMVSSSGAKGGIGLFFGMAIGSVGIDQVTGVNRLMFGQWQLSSGIGLTAFLMGLFAISEVLSQSGELSGLRITTRVRRVPFIPPKDERDEMWKGITIGSLLGTFTGILPAVGQDTATVLAYNQTKTMSKHPEKFGTGYAAGIAASESSNNAVNGGALIPLCCLGIPGDNVTAALIGGLMIHGLQPGPMLAVDAPEVIGCIMLVYFIANIIMYLMETGLMNIFVQMIRIPKSLLFPAILVCCVLGVYAINNRIFEVLVMVVSGIVAYFLLNYFKLDLIAILLGYLLGPLLETYLRTAMIADQGNLLAFTQHPIALGLIVAAVIVLAGQAFFRKSRRKKLLR